MPGSFRLLYFGFSLFPPVSCLLSPDGACGRRLIACDLFLTIDPSIHRPVDTLDGIAVSMHQGANAAPGSMRAPWPSLLAAQAENF